MSERARHESAVILYTITRMHRMPRSIAGVLAGLGSVACAGRPPLAASRGMTMRPEILGSHGIVAAGRHYSVSAGVRIMQQGGNAIDAGVATVFAASVVEISHFGFGGEVPTMIYDAKTHEIHRDQRAGAGAAGGDAGAVRRRTDAFPATVRSARRFRR